MPKVLAVLLFSVMAVWADSSAPDLATIIKGIDRAEESRRQNLGSYSVLRTYSLTASPGKPPAEMEVRLNYHQGGTKTFQILSMRNAEGLRKRVFEHIIDGEAEASKHASQTHINSYSYNFAYVGQDQWDGRPCYVLKLIPKRRDKLLIDGQVWVDAADFGVAKITGRPAASLSFWIGKPYLTQEFRKEGRFWLASRNVTLTDVKLFGRTRLTVRYGPYEFAGATVSAQPAAEVTARVP